MNTSKNIKLTIIFLVSALIGLSGYSRFLPVAGTESLTDTGETMATTTSGDSEDILTDITLEDSEKEKDPVVSKKSIAPVSKSTVVTLPGLNIDKIVINSNITDDKKKEYAGRMKDIAGAIKRGEPLFEHLLELASYRKLVEDYTGAEEIWVYMTKRYPDSRPAYENLGNLYHFYQSNFPKAETMMKKAIEAEPVYPYSYVNLFELYTLSYIEKANFAEGVLLDGYVKTEKNVLIIVTLAEYYASKGKNTEAKKYFEEVLKFATDMKDERLKTIAQEGLAKLSSTTSQN